MNLRRAFATGTFQNLAAWTIGLGAAGFLAALVIPKRYEARTVLFFAEPAQASPYTGKLQLPELTERTGGTTVLGGQVFLPTVGTKPDAVIDIVRSRAAAVEVVGKHSEALFDGPAEDADLEEFSDAIAYEVSETGQLHLAFPAHDRRLAVQVIQDLVSFADRRVRQLGREFAEGSLRFLESEVARRERAVAERSERLKAALSRSPLAVIADDRSEYVKALVEATAAFQTLEVDLQAADAGLGSTFRAIQKSLAAGVEGEAYTEGAAALRSQILTIKGKMALASKTLAKGSPEMQHLSNSFAAAAKTYVQEMERLAASAKNRTLALTAGHEAARAGLAAKLEGTKKQLLRLRDENLQLVKLALEQRQLTNDLSRAEEQLDLTLKELAIARLAEQKSYAPFVVLDPPYAPERPVFPRRGIFTLAGLGAGLFVGMFFYMRRLSAELSGSDEGPSGTDVI